MHRIVTTHDLTDEFLDGIMEMSTEGCIDYWVSARDYSEGLLQVWVPDYDGDEPAELIATRHSVALAIQTIIQNHGGQGIPTVAGYLERAVVQNDLGDVDWDVADMVIQYATMGELTFG